MSRYAAMCKEVADLIKAAGYIVYLSGNKEYGFFTDAKGEVTVGFSNFSYNPRFFGSYEPTKVAGCGWGIDDIFPVDTAKVHEVFRLAHYPPRWATGGAKVKLLTVQRRLKLYEPASNYSLMED